MEELATLAGGCFWCTEAVFKRLKGVVSVTSGYAGGRTAHPKYEDVTTGKTGHAEAVQIKFDPRVLSFGGILDIFWATHDPTTLNRQGADVGTQYRSVIFYHTDKQRDLAERSRENFQKTSSFGKDVVTEIRPYEDFYPAEEYHQNYYEQNKNSNPYCSLVIAPKIKKLLDKFNSQVKEEYLNN